MDLIDREWMLCVREIILECMDMKKTKYLNSNEAFKEHLRKRTNADYVSMSSYPILVTVGRRSFRVHFSIDYKESSRDAKVRLKDYGYMASVDLTEDERKFYDSNGFNISTN